MKDGFRWLRWFIAGSLAVPFFHQTMLALLKLIGLTERGAFSFAATRPFDVPQVISLSFWGGVWGLILGLVLERVGSRRAFWTIALIFGAVAPTLVAAFVVPPLKGQPIGGGLRLAVVGLLINAAWGVGTAALYRITKARPVRKR
jgi:hypothetical protein